MLSIKGEVYVHQVTPCKNGNVRLRCCDSDGVWFSAFVPEATAKGVKPQSRIGMEATLRGYSKKGEPQDIVTAKGSVSITL